MPVELARWFGEVGEPAVHRLEAGRIEGVASFPAITSDTHQTCCVQHLQVLGHAGLRDGVLGGQFRNEICDGFLTVGEQLENSTARRVAECGER